MKATIYLAVRIAWAVAKVLYDFAKKRQEILTPEEKKEWNKDWVKDFRSNEGTGSFQGPGIVLENAIEKKTKFPEVGD